MAVPDERSLKKLGNIAQAFSIGDSEATHPQTDWATLPGELACRQVIGSGQVITVLLPSGLDALQRSGQFSEPLPYGLKWTSRPPR